MDGSVRCITRPWPSARRPGPGSRRQGRSAGAAGCTTSHHKTHSADAGDETAVLYAWHPWTGRTVRLHEVIERATDTVARCSLVDVPVTRLQEIPVWMLDPVACRTVRAMDQPITTLSALIGLHALFADAVRGRGGQAPSGTTLASPESWGDRHATSSAPAAPVLPAARTRSDERAGVAVHPAGLGRPPGIHPAHAEEPPDAPAGNARRRRFTAGRASRRQGR